MLHHTHCLVYGITMKPLKILEEIVCFVADKEVKEVGHFLLM